MARYKDAVWNPVPESCFTKKRTVKVAVCLHRMVGWAPYMRTPHPEAVRRRISAHFTIDMKGQVQQHVDTAHVSHAQGIRQDQYAFAAKNWRLFKNRNPNQDVISIELEDGGKPFNDSRPMPPRQAKSLVDLVRWLVHDVIAAVPVLNETVISHDILTTNRAQDPGDWVMKMVMDELGGYNSVSPSAASSVYKPKRKVLPRTPSRRSKQILRRQILSGRRKCTFNDAVTLGWIAGDEANEWSRRVWYTLRKHGHSPLAPWQDGFSLYKACCGTIMAESGGNPKATNVNKFGPLPGGERGESMDRGLVQINDMWHPNVSHDQAFDPAFSIDFLVQHFPKNSHWWHGYTAMKKR